MFIYTILSVVMFGLLGMIWKRDDWVNLLFKLVFISMALYGLALTWNDLVNIVNK